MTSFAAPPIAPLAGMLDFALPPELVATAPAEQRGTGRDAVRLMVSRYRSDQIAHLRFGDLPSQLSEGDLLLVNTSATLPAALPAVRAGGGQLVLHLSTGLLGGLWVVECRQPAQSGTLPLFTMEPGERVALPGGGYAHLLAPYKNNSPPRLWVAALDLPQPLLAYLARYGGPIRYSYAAQPWPIEAYQTIFATEPGSAEMPSAGRAFTPALVTALAAGGVRIAPLVLHTGVASQEQGEPPYEELYRVSAATARAVNETRSSGGRVVAVGTTAARAIESVADQHGVAHPGRGWTDLVITPERGLRVVDGLLTGFHEPRATHLAMLEALAGRGHLAQTYAEALAERYLWHEFGDLHLLLP